MGQDCQTSGMGRRSGVGVDVIVGVGIPVSVGLSVCVAVFVGVCNAIRGLAIDEGVTVGEQAASSIATITIKNSPSFRLR